MLPRKELVDALAGAFDAAGFDRMLSDYLNFNRELEVGAGSLHEVISKVVQVFDERRYVIELIRAAREANPGSPTLLQFVSRNPGFNPETQPEPQSYFFSVFMRGRRVFCKRHEFRQKLQQIGSAGESRVLAIDGERFTGKTYSRDFINFLRENEPGWSGRQQMIYIDMDDAVLEPEDLARVIGKRLDLEAETMPKEKGEQAPRRIPALMEWLATGLAKSSTSVWWLILDGFRVQVQPSATHDFIRALIDAVDRDQGDKVRMILLNYKEFLDLDTSTFILREEIDPIDETCDLLPFFRHVYTLSKKSFVDDDVTQAVANVRRQVDAEVARRGPEWRMKLLSIGLTEAAKKLLQ